MKKIVRRDSREAPLLFALGEHVRRELREFVASLPSPRLRRHVRARAPTRALRPIAPARQNGWTRSHAGRGLRSPV
jgi:hypothetical protein